MTIKDPNERQENSPVLDPDVLRELVGALVDGSIEAESLQALVDALSEDVVQLMARWGINGDSGPLEGTGPFVNVDRDAEFPATYAWRFAGIYDGEGGGSLGGRRPNGRQVETTGVTLLSVGGDEPLVKVYIDWPRLLADLGLVVSTRTLIETE